MSDNWFHETSPMWPGQQFSLKVKKELCNIQSPFQHIQVFETQEHGRCLVLDNVIQLTERDEASYQEMITLLPINSHPNPEKVLVIGGGDGGVIRELNKHPKVKKIVQCEIDEKVIEISKKYIPSLACGFSSNKLTLHTGDGAKFVQEGDETFDVIITDASDPIVSDGDGDKEGPATSLFNEEYYVSMKAKLNDGGILCCQGENMWLHTDLICNLIKKCKTIFPVVEYAYTMVPTYPSGQIGFILCSNSMETNFKIPLREWGTEEADTYDLKYYSGRIHKAAFVLPMFMERKLKECEENKSS